MSSFLSHIIHGVESGVQAFAMTGNPIVGAGAGVLGATAPDGNGNAGSPLSASTLLPDLQAELPATQSSVNSLSKLANNNQDLFGDLIDPDAQAA